jgi:hypothetical protein
MQILPGSGLRIGTMDFNSLFINALRQHGIQAA